MPSPSAYRRSARVVPCDLCQSQQFLVLADADRRGQPLVTVMCQQCGLISHEQVPTDAELAAYYQANYRRDYHGQPLPAPHRILRAWEGAKWLVARLKPYLPVTAQIGEIGAGLGCTVKRLSQSGYNASGIEPGVDFQWFAEHRLRANVTRQNLFDLPPCATFDVLLLVHVIEHFNSPRRALLHVRDLLRPQGRVYVECPNILGPHAAPGRQFHAAHIHNFSPTTLSRLAQSCGFRVFAKLTHDDDPNLRCWLEVSTAAPSSIDHPDGEEALVAWQCQSALRYYGRWRYWTQKVARDWRFAWQHVAAHRRLERLLSAA